MSLYEVVHYGDDSQVFTEMHGSIIVQIPEMASSVRYQTK